MALTSIGNQKTPGRPVEITFEAELGLPSALQEVCLIGKKDAASGTATAYEVVTFNNVADPEAAQEEADEKFGAGSQLAKMVMAAVKANAGSSSFPAIKCVPLQSTDTDFGAADAALTAVARVKAEFIVSPFDGQDSALRDKLKATCILMSGANRVHNNQFGTMGVVFNRSEADPADLDLFDTPAIIGVWLPDSGTPDYSVAEMASAAAARIASNPIPFNPLNDVTIQNVAAPEDQAEWPTVGAGLESETCLNRGWTPLRVKPNGEVAFVRTVTGRISPDGTGTPVVTAYYDVQDFQVLYYYRKTVYTRFSQPDFKQRKASAGAGIEIKSEAIRLARLFEDQEMFQAVSQLAKQFKVERNLTDRHRMDLRAPVNVVPGLHVIATNVAASTQFDVVTI